MQIQKADKYRSAVIALLTEEKLPVADLPVVLDNFYATIIDDIIVSAIGLEIHGAYGLLRSLAVNKAYRNKGIAGTLLARIEQLAADKSLLEIYLLTETAADYFAGKGYQKINRATVPAEIQQSGEFSYLCPTSAIVMKKSINN